MQHDGGPQGQADLEGGESPGVEDRCGDHHPGPGVQRDAADDGHQRAEAFRRATTGALGRTGGAGCEHDDPAVLLRRAQVARQRAGHQLLAGAFVEPGQLGGESEDPLGELVVVHQQPQLLLLGDGAELGRGEPGVDQHRVDAEQGGGDDRLDQPVVVAAEHADPVAGLHAVPGPHRPGHPFGPVEQVVVGQFDAVLVDDRRPAGIPGGRLAQFASQAPPPGTQGVELRGDSDRVAGGEQSATGQGGDGERQVHAADLLGVVRGRGSGLPVHQGFFLDHALGAAEGPVGVGAG